MKNENQLLEGFQELEENQLLEVFQVEELEKRYEFGWGPSSASGTGSYNSNGGWSVSGTATWTF